MSAEVKFSPTQMMIVAAARLLEDNKSVFVGTGLPIIAALVAQRLYAPNLFIVFEAGGLGPRLPIIPVSVGESFTTHKAVMASSMDYVMSLAQLGYVDYGFLGAGQIDPYGNINTTVIGDWNSPKVRFPGSGGANDVASLSWKTIIIMRQDKRKFVEKLDFLTTPGYMDGNREKWGLPKGTGPYRVVTQLAIYDFNSQGRMRLHKLFPGVTVDDVVANTGFELDVPEKVETVEPPTTEELEAIKQVDPLGVIVAH